MNTITRLFPPIGPAYRVIIIVLTILSGVLWLALQDANKTIADLRKDISVEQVLSDIKSDIIVDQNEAVLNLDKQRREDVQQYQANLARAENRASAFENRADYLLSLKPTATDELGLCREASALIDQEIEYERQRLHPADEAASPAGSDPAAPAPEALGPAEGGPGYADRGGPASLSVHRLDDRQPLGPAADWYGGLAGH
jgi:hypothetical protein